MGFCVASTMNGRGNGKRRAFNRNLIFLHRFQQGGLRFGGGAIHLVGQQHLTEERPATQDEFVLFAVKDVGSGHVGRQQIRRELEPLVLRTENAGESLGQRGLGDAGHAFEKDVAAGQQGDQELMRHALHADDDLTDLRRDAVAEARICCSCATTPREKRPRHGSRWTTAMAA